MTARSATPRGASNQRALIGRRPALVLAVLAGTLLLASLLDTDAPGSDLSWGQAVVLGAVEGFTEYLPISSTGHLLIAGRLLGLGDAADGTALGTYVIAIQVGAIAAVLGLYRTRVAQIVRGALGRDPEGRRILHALAVAFAPAAIAGIALESVIKDRLFGPWPIVTAWVVGGVALLIWQPVDRGRTLGPASISLRQAMLIGVAQTAALWPGTSRSLVTLVAALAVGLSLATAVEFSFLLGVVTLTAATGWDLTRNGTVLVETYGLATPALGALVAFVTAVMSVRWMTTYLQHHSLRIFGAYRLAAGAFTASLLLIGIL